MVKNLIALKKQKRVGYFLFFHSRNCLMKTKGSHITHNAGQINAVQPAFALCVGSCIAFNLYVMLSFFFFFFLCVGCISFFLPKNNLFEYQAVMKLNENLTKYI